MLKNGDLLLSGRFELQKLLGVQEDREFWNACEQSSKRRVLIRTWKYVGENPDPVHRACFNAELRNLFRISGLPGASDSLLTIRDAGIERKEGQGWLVLALNTPGFTTLADLLKEREDQYWLSELDDLEVRKEIWSGFAKLADGIGKLHDCQIIHRAIAPDAVYFDATHELDGMKLGALDWSLRVGDAGLFEPIADESFPISFESDWFAFGAILTRVFTGINVDSDSAHYASELARAIRRSPLLDFEQQVLLKLLAPTHAFRQSRASDVLRQLAAVIATLETPQQKRRRLVLVCQVGDQGAGGAEPLTEEVLKIMRAVSNREIEPAHVGPQLEFIRQDLSDNPRICRRRGGKSYLLIGKKLSYVIWSHDQNGELKDWQVARCARIGDLGHSTEDEQLRLENTTISTFDDSYFFNHSSSILTKADSWRPQLPTVRNTGASNLELREYQEFFRVTNQIEVLMRASEILPYEVLNRKVENGIEILTVKERHREPKDDFFARQGMVAMLSLQFPLHSSKSEQQETDFDHVYLGPESSLSLEREEVSYWRIIKYLDDAVVLSRPVAEEAAPDSGFLRTRGMFGQVELLKRRKRAIDRLLEHSYLLYSMLHPNPIFTQLEDLPLDLNHSAPDGERLDNAKTEAIDLIWKTRPLFTLQGPPGTGKTFLVASLTRLIFAESDVDQVLISAQAHPAIDNLRSRVNRVFDKIDHKQRPLAIRIPRNFKWRTEDKDNDYPRPVAKRVLQQARNHLKVASDSPIRNRWATRVSMMLAAMEREDLTDSAAEFVRLVQQSANITYASSTSAELALLSESPNSFDWCIIEEAGKAHGFDLVLPLQNAYRWLLIGDHQQLPPYRIKDYLSALYKFGTTVKRLRELHEPSSIVDIELINRWLDEKKRAKEADELEEWHEQQTQKEERWKKWLPVFKDIYLRCERAQSPVDIHKRLYQQHRMHSVISDLVSSVFYETEGESGIESMTFDKKTGEHFDRVVHPFTRPQGIAGCPIVWLDVPWRSDGEETENGRYTSHLELEAIRSFLGDLSCMQTVKELGLAVLSPYRSQYALLREELSFLNSARARPSWLCHPDNKGTYASTVDSFQGREADIVIVSLVRNNRNGIKPDDSKANDYSPKNSLGFLLDDERMNVLLSRAQMLLVLVGSWDFFNAQVQGLPEHPGELEPLRAWKKTIDYVSRCFESKTACLVRNE